MTTIYTEATAGFAACRAFEQTSLATQPYRHCRVHGVLDPETAGALLDWLDRDAPWLVNARSFYVQHECYDLIDRLRGLPASAATAPDVCGTLRTQLERLFAIRLHPTQVAVHAHKLTPGQFIQSHNDRPTRGLPTHRVIVSLNRDYDESYGGELVLFDRRDIAGTAVVVPPLHNSGIAIEFSADSWHSVEEVRGGVRYSVIYSFWQEDAVLPAGRTDVLPADEFEWLLNSLTALGADRVAHTRRSLLDHLTGTYHLLSEWGCDADVCRAGLFHSVFGTRGFSDGQVLSCL